MEFIEYLSDFSRILIPCMLVQRVSGSNRGQGNRYPVRYSSWHTTVPPDKCCLRISIRPRRLPSESFITQLFTNYSYIDIIQSAILTETLNKPFRMHPLQFCKYYWHLRSFVTDTNTQITAPQLPSRIGLGIVLHRTRFEVFAAILRISSDTV